MRNQNSISPFTPNLSRLKVFERESSEDLLSAAAMEMVVEGQNQSKIGRNQIRIEETMENEEGDRISTLADYLLLEILSRLPSTKDAVKTGTLSKRWEHLWTSLPTLIFTDRGFNHPLSDFVSFVEKTLTQCRQLKLQKFEVHTSYDIQFESQFNSWIRYAVRCDVEELNLTFYSWGTKAALLLDQNFFTGSSFVDLKLSGCVLNPTRDISWKNLKRLCISCGKLDEDLIENILSGSPLLEILALNFCSGYRRLNITSKSVKYLVFISYMVTDDQFDSSIIEINAPHILYLTIQGDLWLWKLSLLNASSLVEAELDYSKGGHWEITREKTEEDMLKGLILNLLHVKEVIIGELCYELLFRLVAKGFIFPPNLKFPGIPYGWWSDSDSDESEDCDSVGSEDL